MRKVTLFSLILVLSFQFQAVGKIVDRQDVVRAADFIIMEAGDYRHPEAKNNNYSLKDVQPLLYNNQRIGYIVNMKPHGFMIMPDATELNPVKFISYTGDFTGIKDHPIIQSLIEQLYYSKTMLNYPADKVSTAGKLSIDARIDIDRMEEHKALWQQLLNCNTNNRTEDKGEMFSRLTEKKDALRAVDLIKNFGKDLKKTKAYKTNTQDFDFDLSALNEKLSGHFKNRYTHAVSFKDYGIPLSKWFATFKDQIDNKWPFLIGFKIPGYPGFDTVVVDGYLAKWGNKIHVDLRKENYSDIYLDLNNPCHIEDNTINSSMLNIYKPSTSEYIEVTYPESGVTNTIGTEEEIQWHTNFCCDNYVNIKLMQNSLYIGQIVYSTINYHYYSYDFSVFTDGSPLSPGDNYIIRIKSFEYPTVIGYSEKFSLTGEPASIEILFPYTDVVWSIGNTYDIVWATWGIPQGENNINIKLIQNSTYKGQIVGRTINDCYYSWTISTFTDGTPIEPGTGYKVRIKSMNPEVVCYSGSFTIID